jgi:alpha-L-rhamnosidase
MSAGSPTASRQVKPTMAAAVLGPLTTDGDAEICVRPLASGLTSASGTVPTERGDIQVSWHKVGGRMTLPVDVPVNVKAEIDLPTTGKVNVHSDAKYVGQRASHTVYEAGSGHLTFIAQA